MGIIRPLLLFRKREDVSRAIIGVTMWWECVELSPHHFQAAQAHALASRPGHGAESPRRVFCCTLHHSSIIIISQVGGCFEGNNRRNNVVGVCRIVATPFSSRASACTCEWTRNGAESPRRVFCCTLHHSSIIIISQVGGCFEG